MIIAQAGRHPRDATRTGGTHTSEIQTFSTGEGVEYTTIYEPVVPKFLDGYPENHEKHQKPANTSPYRMRPPSQSATDSTYECLSNDYDRVNPERSDLYR